MSIISGNLDAQIETDAKRRGWFLGHFMDQGTPFKTQNCECKWAVHKAGNVKATPQAAFEAHTVVILIEGAFTVRFLGTGETVELKKQGDYLYYDGAEQPHEGTAVTDAKLLVIRWPSDPLAYE